MGWSKDGQVTQITLQSKFADAIEKDRKINCLHFQINQAQQSVKTDLELAKAMGPDNMNDEFPGQNSHLICTAAVHILSKGSTAGHPHHQGIAKNRRALGQSLG
jgi:hypothetical protein